MNNIEKKHSDWLDLIEREFELKGLGGEDFFYVIQTIVNEKKMTFRDIVKNAATGCGCVVHEGLFYSLDQDWEDPSLFDEVVFFVGNYESSTLSIKDYFYLLLIAIKAYISSSPEEKEEILENYNIAIERYRHLMEAVAKPK